ncbi:LysR family transcriptional regulator [Anaerorhabdus sp.]|jgi:LysR family transcriptional regulator, transcriptional activator of the cysJI operon|uniref:LysR family transcriptional regulator n=1 Tax=Anaerorhabdus sp. TaxID=1872524 RepID=UPI002FC5CF20
MLDIKIETFIAVVHYESYTAAAESLHMTQPAVTQHIHKLEDYYDCKLIDSSKRSIKLTESGKLLYNYLSLQKANEDKFKLQLKKTINPMCLGASLSIADYYLPRLIKKQFNFSKERIRISVSNTTTILHELSNGNLDCALVEGLFDNDIFESIELIKVPFIPVVSHSHPYANKSVTINQLHQFPLVLREPCSGTREIFENWLLQKNDSFKSFSECIELGSFTLIKEIVAKTNAVTFLYEGVANKEIKNNKLSTLNLKGFKLEHPFYFIYRKGDPDTSHLLDFYKTLFTNFSSLL